MNWILLLIVFMFAAILAGPASADTVTAVFPATLLSNPTYAIVVCSLTTLVLAFFWVLWHASGSDRPKIKAELLHTPQKATEPPSVTQQLLDAAEKVPVLVIEPKEGEFATFHAANEACKAKEPTWFIREEYNRGVVKWRLYKISYQVKACRGSPFWRISQKPFFWGAQEGYDTLPEAQAVMSGFVREDHEQRKPRELLYYDRSGLTVKQPELVGTSQGLIPL